MINGAAMNIQLYGIESQILKLLSESEGNILDNTELIGTLAEAKARFPALLYVILFVASGDYPRKAACCTVVQGRLRLFMAEAQGGLLYYYSGSGSGWVMCA